MLCCWLWRIQGTYSVGLPSKWRNIHRIFQENRSRGSKVGETHSDPTKPTSSSPLFQKLALQTKTNFDVVRKQKKPFPHTWFFTLFFFLYEYGCVHELLCEALKCIWHQIPPRDWLWTMDREACSYDPSRSAPGGLKDEAMSNTLFGWPILGHVRCGYL